MFETFLAIYYELRRRSLFLADREDLKWIVIRDQFGVQEHSFEILHRHSPVSQGHLEPPLYHGEVCLQFLRHSNIFLLFFMKLLAN